jgi:hypothetical protein
VTFPVVLLCVALAFATIVWSSSEHEAQRAADQAATRAAATAFLGTDFPYVELPALPEVTYPDVDAIAAEAGLTPPGDVSECGTVGLPTDVVPGATITASLTAGLLTPSATVTSPALPGTLTLPADCSDVTPYAPPVALGDTDQSWNVACDTAEEAMSAEHASYSHGFYKGDDNDPQPTCDNGRIDVRLATGTPLVGFGTTARDAVTGALDATIPDEYATVRAALAEYGIHLDTALPNLVCPEISVDVRQPVREPVFDNFSTPNGLATARRIVKNAVVVPVYDGLPVASADTGAVRAAVLGKGVEWDGPGGVTVSVPPVNLNSILLDRQKELLALLDEVDAIADAAIRAANVSVDALNGTFTGIDPTQPQPAPSNAAEPLQSLRLTKCLRDTLGQIYDPPSGDAPTADEVLAAAAESGEQVVLVQVGTVEADCAEAGAIEVDSPVAGAPECVRAATTPQVNPLTGVYEVPFFDVTPALVQDLGDGNFATVPLHATQAAGAFRGGLVRAPGDTRYDPKVEPPTPTPQCDVTVLPAPTPSTACDILSVTPSPVTTPQPSATTVVPTLPQPSATTLLPLPSATTLLPKPSATTILPTVPVPTTTLPTIKPPGGLL